MEDKCKVICSTKYPCEDCAPRQAQPDVLALVRCFHGGVDDLVFWSFRYFLGRKTIATCQFAEDLARAWPLLREHTQTLIRKELDEEFLRDDGARATGEKWKPLGLDCDRATWQKVRDAYL